MAYLFALENIGMEYAGFMAWVVKFEDQRRILKKEHQISYPFIVIETKEDEKWMTRVMAGYSFPILLWFYFHKKERLFEALFWEMT